MNTTSTELLHSQSHVRRNYPSQCKLPIFDNSSKFELHDSKSRANWLWTHQGEPCFSLHSPLFELGTAHTCLFLNPYIFALDSSLKEKQPQQEQSRKW